MSSFNQQQLNYKVQNANAVECLLGDQVIAYCQTSTLSSSLGAEQLYGIGSSLPQEIQQLRLSPSITIDYFELTPDGYAFLGYPSTLAEVLANNEFSFSIFGASGVPVLTFVGCVAGDYNSNISANQPVTSSISFLAMDILDPLGSSILNSNSVIQVASTIASALNIAGI
jgi:hypothetical protein